MQIGFDSTQKIGRPGAKMVLKLALTVSRLLSSLNTYQGRWEIRKVS
jgi:hypothetical protein